MNESREHIRVPLDGQILYVSEDFVFKALINNISMGGLLLSELPYIPNDEHNEIMFTIPRIDHFDDWSDEDVELFNNINRERDVFRAKVKVIHQDERSDLEELFSQVGCHFLELDDYAKNAIKNYVDIFALNLVDLVSLYESNAEGNSNRILDLASILGYQTKNTTFMIERIYNDVRNLKNGA